MRSSYPQFPGFQSGSETSRDAAEEVGKGSANVKQELLLKFFTSDLGKGIGLTIDEAAVYLKRETKEDVQTGTASARMRGLELLGFIVKSSKTRTTRAKKRARVYFLRGYGNE